MNNWKIPGGTIVANESEKQLATDVETVSFTVYEYLPSDGRAK